VEIIDFERTSDLVVSYSDVRDIAHTVGMLVKAKGLGQTYFYASADLAYGIARMFQAVAEPHGVVAEVYRDWDEMMTVIRMRLPK
jgi:hypothetical protein